MRPTASVSSISILLFVGSITGLLHAAVETGLVRWLGVGLTAADLAIQTLVWAAAGAAALAACGAPLLWTQAWANEPERRFGLAVMAAAAVYSLTLAWVIAERSGFGTALLWAGPAGLAAVLAAHGVGRTGRKAAATAGLLSVSALLCGVQLVQTEAPRLAAGQQSRFYLTVLAALAPLVVFGAAWAYRGGRRARTGWVPVAVAFVFAGLALAMGPQAGYFGRTILRPPALAEAPPPGNVFLIVLDTVRADHLELFGYERETMPRLAARARRDFDVVMKSQSVAPWTLPSHASMFTGLYPWAHGARRARVTEEAPNGLAFPLRGDTATLAEMMSAAGYATAGVVANFPVVGSYDLDRGFEHYDLAPGVDRLSAEFLWIHQLNSRNIFTIGTQLYTRLPESIVRRTGAFDRFRFRSRRAQEVRKAATAWIDRRDDRPFLLFLNMDDPHAEYSPEAEDSELFAPRPPGMHVAKFREARDLLRERGVAPEPADLAYYMGQYDGELRTLDRGLEGFLSDLEQRGLYEEALIIVVSDHGEAFLEHRLMEHATSLFQTQIEVPLLIKAPRSYSFEKALASEAMQQVDLLPTIFEVLGLQPPESLHGAPWGRLRNHTLSELYCAMCGSEAKDWSGADFDGLRRTDAVAVTDGGKKVAISSTEPITAYDLDRDPGELRPLGAIPSELQRKALDLAAGRRFERNEMEHTESPATIDNLRALGYIQ